MTGETIRCLAILMPCKRKVGKRYIESACLRMEQVVVRVINEYLLGGLQMLFLSELF